MTCCHIQSKYMSMMGELMCNWTIRHSLTELTRMYAGVVCDDRLHSVRGIFLKYMYTWYPQLHSASCL